MSFKVIVECDANQPYMATVNTVDREDADNPMFKEYVLLPGDRLELNMTGKKEILGIY